MLADKAMEDPCKPGNPRDVSKEEFIKMIDDENIVPSVLQRYYLIKDKLDLNW